MSVVGEIRNLCRPEEKASPGILKAKSDKSTILTVQYLLGLFIKTGISREEMLHEIVDSFEFGDI